LAAQAAAIACLFAFLEVLKDVRDAQWSGYGTMELAGMAAGWAVYFAALLLVSGLVSGGLRFLGQPLRTAAGGFVAGAAAWAMLSPFREFFPTSEDALVAAALLGIAVAAMVLGHFTRIPFAAACGAMAVAFLTGITMCITSSYLHWFEAGRPAAATRHAVMACGGAGTLALVAWWLFARRHIGLRVAVAVALILAPLLGLAPAAPGKAGAPVDAHNRVLIVADTLRADVLAPYGGHVEVPHIAALAGRGTLFEQCYSVAPWTPPSMTSMFSGQYPPGLNPDTPPEAWLDQLWRYEVSDLALNPAAQYVEAGFATGAFVSNALVPQFPHLLTPFAAQAFYHPMLLRPAGLFARLPFLRDMLASVAPVLAPTRPADTTAALTRAARWFLWRHRNTAFFLYVHYMTPHAPYDPPARFRETMAEPWPFFYPYPGGERWGIPPAAVHYQLAAAERDYVRMLYDAEVRYTDEATGQILAMVDRLGLRERTEVIFTADHGEELWEHGNWGHGQSLYEELIRVPLIIAGEGPPRRIQTPVSLIGAAGLLGLNALPEWIETNDLREAARGEVEFTPRPIFAQGTSNRADPPLQMVRHGAWKLIRDAKGGNPRLFNLESDPGEQDNLAASHPGRVAELHGLLDAWQATFTHVFPVEDEIAPLQRNDMLERLESLGYLH
jgi:arylsulfatase A-like enzyme